MNNLSQDQNVRQLEIQSKLEYYCAYQERCTKEVIDKIKSFDIQDQDTIDRIVIYLKLHNYLCDERYSELYTVSKFNSKKWGKLRINMELKSRDISQELITQALQSIDEDDYIDTLLILIEKLQNKFQSLDIYKQKQKIIQYLSYRGWEQHLIYEYLFEKYK